MREVFIVECLSSRVGTKGPGFGPMPTELCAPKFFSMILFFSARQWHQPMEGSDELRVRVHEQERLPRPRTQQAHERLLWQFPRYECNTPQLYIILYSLLTSRPCSTAPSRNGNRATNRTSSPPTTNTFNSASLPTGFDHPAALRWG